MHCIVGWARIRPAGSMICTTWSATRISWRQVRRQFCDQGWCFAHNGVVFRGASSVAVTRYRYRGTRIATLWTTIQPAAG